MKIYVAYLALVSASLLLFHVAQRTRNRRFQWAFAVVPAALLVLFLWEFTYPPGVFNDFNIAYYPAGKSILSDPSKLYYPDPQQSVRGFVNFPLVAMVFAPLSALPIGVAQTLFLLAGVLCIVIAYGFLASHLRLQSQRKQLLLLLFAMNGPLIYSLRLGNTTHFVFLMMLFALAALHQKKQTTAGLLLGAASVLKIPILSFCLFLMVKKNWKALAVLISVFGAALFLSVFIFGTELHRTWYERCIQPFAGSSLGAFNVQSIDAFLTRLITGGNADHWRTVPASGVFAFARLAVILALTAWTIAALRARSNQSLSFLYDASLFLIWILIVSPISWTHYYLFLLLPVALYLSNPLMSLQLRALGFAVVLLSCAPVLINMVFFRSSTPALQFIVSRVLISHYLFGAIGLMILLRLNRRYFLSNESRIIQQEYGNR